MQPTKMITTLVARPVYDPVKLISTKKVLLKIEF